MGVATGREIAGQLIAVDFNDYEEGWAAKPNGGAAAHRAGRVVRKIRNTDI